MCDRKIDGQVNTFGTTGYTMNNVFVLYDRATGSVWYPLGERTVDAVSGDKKGAALEFLSKPDPVPLEQWQAKHPGTLVLLPPAGEILPSRRGFLGVRLADDGEVEEVVAGSGAEKAGIRVGDRLLKVGERSIERGRDLRGALRNLGVGRTTLIVVERDGDEKVLETTLGKRPGR